MKDFLPLLRNTEACSKDGMAVCDRVEVGLQEWTNQGAQVTVSYLLYVQEVVPLFIK